MTSVRGERHLVSVALTLIDGSAALTAAEQELARRVKRVPGRGALSGVRAAIRRGEDPLGDAFIALRPADRRREAGAVYTPAPIVSSMLAWAAGGPPPIRVVDPGAGSGRFLLAAAARFPHAKLIGIEVDPLAALMLRANLAIRGVAERATVMLTDYRAAVLPPIDGKTLFIGNPPYVRHHAISAAWKRWYAASAASFGVRASTLAGLHLHFFVRTFQLARQGDAGVFITSAEWLDVNYGETLRRLLGEGLGGVALHVLEPGAMPFVHTLTTGAITCFRVGRRSPAMQVRAVPDIGALNGLGTGTPVPWAELRRARRWSVIVKPAPPPPAGFIELGDLCRVRRGQVTGGNAIWIAGDAAKGLPQAVLKPTVTKACELLDAGAELRTADHLKRVVDLPVDLDELAADERRAVDRFLRWAEAQGAAHSYIAQHRRAWWSVLLYEPAPIISTYMARRPPAFVRNRCEAHHLNIAHGLYPRDPLPEPVLSALVAYLRRNVSIASGRTYAGGLTKFEPGELERVPIPALEALRDATTADIDDGAIDCRCGAGAGLKRFPIKLSRESGPLTLPSPPN